MDFSDLIPGVEPDVPAWGQERVPLSPALAPRVRVVSAARAEVPVVVGAGGAFAPDLIHALFLCGHPEVVGIDVQLTYPVSRATYRRVDLRTPESVAEFFRSLRIALAAGDLRLGTVYDLSAIQTSPHGLARRDLGKTSLRDALLENEGDARLFYMSSGEVYGAPPGAPYAEDHDKRPVNPYGLAKLREETAALSWDGLRTRTGRLRTVALRTWTLGMVRTDTTGKIVASRNYNDPAMMVAARLARSGVRVPVLNASALGTIHLAEEVAEVATLLGTADPAAPNWGKAFNCIGRAASHERIRDECHGVMCQARSRQPDSIRRLLSSFSGVLHTRAAAAIFVALLESAGGWLGARDMQARMPFLLRSTHLNSQRLQMALGSALTEPEGHDAAAAVRRVAQGVVAAGDQSLVARRYNMY